MSMTAMRQDDRAEVGGIGLAQLAETLRQASEDGFNVAFRVINGELEVTRIRVLTAEQFRLDEVLLRVLERHKAAYNIEESSQRQKVVIAVRERFETTWRTDRLWAELEAAYMRLVRQGAAPLKPTLGNKPRLWRLSNRPQGLPEGISPHLIVHDGGMTTEECKRWLNSSAVQDAVYEYIWDLPGHILPKVLKGRQSVLDPRLRQGLLDHVMRVGNLPECFKSILHKPGETVLLNRVLWAKDKIKNRLLLASDQGWEALPR